MVYFKKAEFWQTSQKPKVKHQYLYEKPLQNKKNCFSLLLTTEKNVGRGHGTSGFGAARRSQNKGFPAHCEGSDRCKNQDWHSPARVAMAATNCKVDDANLPTSVTGSDQATGSFAGSSGTGSSVLAAPVAADPLPGATINSSQPALTILNSAHDPAAQATYLFQVSPDESFTALSAQSSQVTEEADGMVPADRRLTTTCSVDRSLDDGRFYWRERTRAGTSESAFSAVADFVVSGGGGTSTNPPPSPTPGGGILLDPLIGGSIGEVAGGQFVSDGWQVLTPFDYIQYEIPPFEGCGRQSEKVERHQVLCMIIQKTPSSMGRWRAMANPILGDGGLGNGDAQLRQLAMHAGSSPERVGPAHVPYQRTYFGSNAWSSGPTPSALPSPISSEPTTVPADDRLRFHDDEDALPVGPDSAQQHPKLAVDIREPRPFHRTAEHGELLPKSDILESQLATSLEGRDESANKRRNHAAIKFGARG